MSPFMAIFGLVVLGGVLFFGCGVLLRRRRVLLAGAPAASLFLVWLFLASSQPHPEKEFDRLFGSRNRILASDIRTMKPTLMDGCFIQFRMPVSNFDEHVRPQFSHFTMGSNPNILLGQSLPHGWPSAIEFTTQVLHRIVDFQDVYLIYFPEEATAYASVLYSQW